MSGLDGQQEHAAAPHDGAVGGLATEKVGIGRGEINADNATERTVDEGGGSIERKVPPMSVLDGQKENDAARHDGAVGDLAKEIAGIDGGQTAADNATERTVDGGPGTLEGGQQHSEPKAAVPDSPVLNQNRPREPENSVDGTPPVTSVASDADDVAQRARDVETEASEHLARRAAEMDLTAEDNEARSAGQNLSDKDELPESPPPPPPPRKDSRKIQLPVVETATGPESGEKRAPQEIAQDVPEAPQGANEAPGHEIKDIMDQFQNGTGGMGEQEIMSPRLDRQQSVLVLPPRSSSLEAKDSFPISPQNTGQSISSQRSIDRSSIVPSASGPGGHQVTSDDTESIRSVTAGSIFQPPLPTPEPEPSLPFDFHRFLEQLRHRTADPVARFLRSFLNEFGKKQWMVHEQVKIISDFLAFITTKMGQCEVWRTVSDAEFDNAREGMEKLVMNRLYSQTFSPAIPPAAPSPRKSGRAARAHADVANPHGPGRRGQHQEDVERDEVIAQKMRIYGWIREEHLDIQPIGDKGQKFLTMAQQELLKINTYRAPRDKVICVLNCCKVIFGFLKNSKADQSADAFVPLLIYTVLRAKPEHLVSNVQYIWRFRNQDKLGGEAGYYMSSLMGVVTFIENLDRTNLTISDEDFERNVEQAVSAIAEKNKEREYEEKAHAAPSVRPMPHLSEKSALSRPEVTPRNSMEAERSSPRRTVNQRLSEKPPPSSGAVSDDEDVDAVSGLLRTIQKPLNSIGKIFSDEGAVQQGGLKPTSSPQPGATPRGLSPAPNLEARPPAAPPRRQGQPRHAADEVAARHASVEAAEVQRLRVREHQVVVETLQSMFPNLDKDVIEDVTRAQEGNVSRAVDACLALSG